MSISNNKTSLLINSQVPEFVRNDHPQFVKFLEKYYQFMELEKGAINVSKKLNDNLNIDTASDDFEKKLYDNFLLSIPQTLIVDKKLLLKHIKSFYRSRGSEKSLRFLLNILTPKIFVPESQRVNVLRLKNTLYNGVSNNSLSVIYLYHGKDVTGTESGATGIVEEVTRTTEYGSSVDELTIVSVQGDFIPGENVYSRYEDGTSFSTLESQLFYGGLESVRINQLQRGYGYLPNTVVPVIGGSGSNGSVIISKVTPGNVNNIVVTFGGAGFLKNSFVEFTSTSGSGANAKVTLVDTTGFYHPNSYIIYTSTIDQEANTLISNTKYSNLNSSVSNAANQWFANVIQSFVYSNCGPVTGISVAYGGNNYVELPSTDILSNTLVKRSGTLGRITIVNGGSNYASNDKIIFINPIGYHGIQGQANVTNVSNTGAILNVQFESVNGDRPGGYGYDQNNLPSAVVVSATGNGANISVGATLGDGEILLTTNTVIGAIEQFTVLNEGDGYLTPPLLDLSGSGSGDAAALATVRSGVLKWPSRYIYGKGRFTADREISVYYPKTDILKASDGKWNVERVIRVTDTQVDNTSNSLFTTLQKFEKTQIRGATTNTTAIVERVNRYFEGGTKIDELIISSMKGDFINGENISGFFSEDGIAKYISSNIFSGTINTVIVTNSGTSYNVGDVVTVESNTGSNGSIVVSRVGAGNIKSVVVLNGGAGFIVNNPIIFSSITGFDANAYVSVVQADGLYHPNSYNIISSTINLEANTAINNTKYSNLSISITNPANSMIQNLMSSYVLSNVGPVATIIVSEPGRNYKPPVLPDIVANSSLKTLGALGRVELISGGSGYQKGEKIYFNNIPGGYGYGAMANITNVSISGTITRIKLESIDGREQPGGAGYEQRYLPIPYIISSNGSNAVLSVGAVLGDGETLLVANSTIGGVEELLILDRGSGYEAPPTLNLSLIGDGTAQAVTTIIDGIYSYPGRYINDDGLISEANYIQDSDYYQNYSYVVKTKESLINYRTQLTDTVHPAGMITYGEVLYEDSGEIESSDVEVYQVEILTY